VLSRSATFIKDFVVIFKMNYPIVYPIVRGPIAYGSNSVKTFIPFTRCGVNTGPLIMKTAPKIYESGHL